MRSKKSAGKKINLMFFAVSAALLAASLLLFSCGKEEPHKHTLEFRSPKAATCVEEGSIGYWVCSECDTYFSDPNGKNVIEDKGSTIIEKTKHIYGERLAYDESAHFYLCKVCGEKKDESAHSFDDISICIGCGYTQFFEGFTFKTVPGGVMVTGTSLKGSVVIPALYRDIPVIGIAEGAFRNNGDITEVIITSGITEIGDAAFESCGSLRNVEIPESVVKIGEKAFRNCGLISVILPGSVRETGSAAFADCSSLKILIIKEGAESIGEAAFRDCSVLEQISLPESLKYIGASAFRSCTALANIKLPTGLSEIGESAFAASGLKKLSVSGNGLKLGDYAFEDCLWLDEAVIGDGVTSLGNSVFGGCIGLKSIKLGKDVKEIGELAFRTCSALKTVIIPKNVTKIGFGAFAGCTSLTEMTLPFTGNDISNMEKYHFGYIFGARSYNDHETAVPKSLKKVTLTSGNSVNASAFRECKYITEITVDAVIDVIGGNAFSGCTSLVKVTIPGSVDAIGYGAFANCLALSEIVFGGSAEQWRAVTKGLSWDDKTGSFKVSCTDSVIEKENI